MSLSTLIQIGGLAKLMTATPATAATQGAENAGTVAEVATVAVASPPPQPPKPVMTTEEETAIRAWFAHIEETDPDIIAEFMDKCRTDPEARTYFLRRAEEVPSPVVHHHWVTCSDCCHFEHTEHPHLGHCAQGEPEAVAGLWDTDHRGCNRYTMKPGYSSA